MAGGKKVKAIFRGANGSLGYETDKEYTLVIHHESGGNIKIECANRAFQVKFGLGKCEYESLTSFLANWDNVRVVNSM